VERAKNVPKQKFSFKSRSRNESPATSTPTTPPPTTIIPEPTNTVPENGVILSTSNAYLSIPADSHSSNLRLLSMSKSVISILRPKRHATLHAKDLSDCLILASSFDGAAHLTNLTNCVVVLKCHQANPKLNLLTVVSNARFTGYRCIFIMFITTNNRELCKYRVYRISYCNWQNDWGCSG